ncbi:hypothetical protein BT69DRAFT_1356249, partial [Atractiella rhizophila]
MEQRRASTPIPDDLTPPPSLSGYPLRSASTPPALSRPRLSRSGRPLEPPPVTRPWPSHKKQDQINEEDKPWITESRRMDPVFFRDRWSNVFQVDRHLLSPAVTEYTEPSEHSSTTSKRSRPKSHRSISGSGIPRPISPTSTYVSDKSATTISTTSQSSFKSRTVSSVSVSELEEPEGDVRSYHSSLSGSPFDLNRERDSKTPTEYRFTGKEKDDAYTGNGGLSRNNTVTKKNFRSSQSRDQRVFTDPQDFRTQQHEQDSISRKRTTSESAHTLKSSKGRPSISDIVDVHRMRVSTPDYSSTSTCGIKGLTLVDEARMWREREEEEELSQTREMERMERMLASGRRGEELLNGSGRSVSSGS